MRRTAALVAAALSLTAAPLRAQGDDDRLDVRGFGLLTVQRFSANKTFAGEFDSAVQPFYGAGVTFVQDGVFLDVAVSRFKKTGTQAFYNAGTVFRLNIPQTVTITPLEISAGYRFRRRRRVIPYVGAGLGKYWFHQTSQGAEPAEIVDRNHVGYLAFGGAELWVHRWIRLSGDVQYSHVSGIIGRGDFSEAVNESDLGGVAGRFRVIIGK